MITLIIIGILTGATLALATLATSDLDIAASDRMGTVAFNESETGIGEVLSDARIALAPSGGGYAPDPGDPALVTTYAPLTTQADATYTAQVQYLREGPVEESSAIQVRSIVYNVSVNGAYMRPGSAEQLARTAVNSEFYRIAPKQLGVVATRRHYQ